MRILCAVAQRISNAKCRWTEKCECNCMQATAWSDLIIIRWNTRLLSLSLSFSDSACLENQVLQRTRQSCHRHDDDIYGGVGGFCPRTLARAFCICSLRTQMCRIVEDIKHDHRIAAAPMFIYHVFILCCGDAVLCTYRVVVVPILIWNDGLTTIAKHNSIWIKTNISQICICMFCMFPANSLNRVCRNENCYGFYLFAVPIAVLHISIIIVLFIFFGAPVGCGIESRYNHHHAAASAMPNTYQCANDEACNTDSV